MKKLILLAMLLMPGVLSAQSLYHFQRKSIFEILPIDSKDIVFVGNSITDGGEWAELFRNPRVKNRGIGADKTDDVLSRLYQVTDGKPKKIFLLIGINDLNGEPENTAKAIKNITGIIERVRTESPSTKLYVQSILPVNHKLVGDNPTRIELFLGKARELAKVNEALKKVCADNKVHYIDLHSVMADGNGLLRKEYTNDGLHLMGQGYRAWASAIRKYVK